MKSYVMQYKYQLAFVAIAMVALAFGVNIGAVSGADAASVGMAFGLATEAVKSMIITNADAVPQVINSAQLASGRERSMRGAVTVTTTKDIGSTYRFFRIKSNDLVKELILDNATAGSGCTADIGLYKTAGDGGAVVDADFFASALDIATANRALDVTRESGVITVANMEKPVWELLGLSADPQLEYDVVMTLTAASAATGAVCLTGTVVGRN